MSLSRPLCNYSRNELSSAFETFFRGTLNGKKDSIRILIIGKRGVGKSSLLNALLHTDAFDVNSGPESNTDSPTEHQQRLINGVDVHCCDISGLFASTAVDKRVISAIKAHKCDFDIVIVCYKFADRFEENQLNILRKLSIRNVWTKVIVALTHADTASEYDKDYPKWRNLIYKHLKQLKVNDAYDVPVVPTYCTALVSADWKKYFVYKMTKRACCIPHIVYALASAIDPMQFLTMAARQLGCSVPQTEEEALKLLQHAIDSIHRRTPQAVPDKENMALLWCLGAGTAAGTVIGAGVTAVTFPPLVPVGALVGASLGATAGATVFAISIFVYCLMCKQEDDGYEETTEL